jgi:hypothetical protein
MKKTVFILVVLAFTISQGKAQMEQQKAKYLYSMLRFIEWPQSMENGSFKIGVYGSFEMYKKIAEETMGRSMGKQNIEVLNISRLDDISLFKLHILVVSENQSNQANLDLAKKKTSNVATLVVANNRESVKMGAALGFYEQAGKLAFNLNKSNAEAKGIRFSNQIALFEGNTK